MDCLEVKKQLKEDVMACVCPYPEELLVYKVLKWVTYRDTTIHCKFFDEQLGWQFYVYKKRFYIIKGNEILFKNFDGCGCTEGDIAKLLYKENKELMLAFLYSLFSRMYTASAAYAYAAASAAAYNAAYNAAYAAYAAAYAYNAAYNAAYAAASDAYDAAAYAYDAYDAANVAYTASARRAFRELMKLRRIILKEEGRE